MVRSLRPNSNVTFCIGDHAPFPRGTHGSRVSLEMELTAKEPGVTSWISRSSSRLNKPRTVMSHLFHESELTPSVLDEHRCNVVGRFHQTIAVRNPARVYGRWPRVVLSPDSSSSMYRTDSNARRTLVEETKCFLFYRSIDLHHVTSTSPFRLPPVERTVRMVQLQ